MARVCCPFDQTNSIGGLTCGGSAFVDLVQDPYDGLLCVLPLDEVADGTEGEFVDRSRQHQDGTGGKILAEDEELDPEAVPLIDDGVFCLPSQHFDGRQSIWIDQDNLGTDAAFTVSLWNKFEPIRKTRCFYSRGFDDATTGERYVVSLGHSFLNTLAVHVNVTASNGTISEDLIFGSTTLTQDTWYHAAMSYDGTSIRLYSNGVLVATKAVSGTIAAATNENFLGQLNGTQPLEGNLQELHLFPEVKSAVYLKAEYDAFCTDFVEVGDEEPLLYW